MLKHRSLTATALTFFFLLVGSVAHADVAGSWKLAVDSNTCDLTLAADGKADGCAPIAKYRLRGETVALYKANGDIVSVLKAKGDTYVGNRQGDNHQMTLSH